MTVIALLLFLTILGTVLLPLPLSWWGKSLLAALCLVISFKFPLFRWLGGPMPFAPHLPPWLILLGGWLFAIALFLALGGLLLSPFQLFLPKARGFLSLGLFLISLLAATVGLFWGQRAPRVREFTLSFPGLPEEAEGLTIALLTDLHADGVIAAREIGQMVDLANARHPPGRRFDGRHGGGTAGGSGAPGPPSCPPGRLGCARQSRILFRLCRLAGGTILTGRPLSGE